MTYIVQNVADNVFSDEIDWEDLANSFSSRKGELAPYSGGGELVPCSGGGEVVSCSNKVVEDPASQVRKCSL